MPAELFWLKCSLSQSGRSHFKCEIKLNRQQVWIQGVFTIWILMNSRLVGQVCQDSACLGALLIKYRLHVLWTLGTVKYQLALPRLPWDKEYKLRRENHFVSFVEHSSARLASVLEVSRRFRFLKYDLPPWHCSNGNQHVIVKLPLEVSEGQPRGAWWGWGIGEGNEAWALASQWVALSVTTWNLVHEHTRDFLWELSGKKWGNLKSTEILNCRCGWK